MWRWHYGPIGGYGMRVPQYRIKYYVLGFYILILASWQPLFSAQIIPDFLFPSPSQLAQRLWELTTDNYLWPSVKATFQRMVIGFSIAAPLAFLLSVPLGLSRWAIP